ncbi:WecB/TagA/CpsF family glycosyltransferase [Arenicella xantha]|uniref:Exopolysaccharide biosynthesis WecB/TagA/CpsF family protein n=1 Tax=Arenicella xantha TaxID=644221 RepID=A0A395JJ51_9GAMM|nr:WecB/TagA/CpsF family glycosyltransferase [Arenicella xantha]RBP49883.1 exopolysaccharide biosynthesis WecB/TagA/CpsF family protein [Arenicella xantha]
MQSNERPATADVFGIPYAITDYTDAAKRVVTHAVARTSFSVFALPVHGVVERRRDAEFAAAIDSASLVVPDGQPIRWVMNWLHGAGLTDRVYGPTLLHHVLASPRETEFRVFVYGGRTIEVQQAFVRHIEQQYPHVVVCGAYREERPDVQTLSAAIVQDTKPNLVVVGLGCPKQEKWIATNQNQIDAALMGVGAAFSFFSGDQQSAPQWMQDRGLEWLYRLIKEPKRLWRRYFYTNTVFIILVFKAFANRAILKLIR